MDEAVLQSKISVLVQEKLKQYRAMPRKVLAQEYMKLSGNEPHPRFAKAWLVTAVARLYQNKLWNEMAGYLPSEIAIADMKFWTSNTCYLEKRGNKDKDAVSPEPPICVGGHGAIQYVPNENLNDMVMIFKDGSENPFSNNQNEGYLFRFFVLLRKKSRLSYDDVKSWCAKHPLRPVPRIIFLKMRKADVCTIEICNQPVSDLEQINTEPLDELDTNVVFDDVGPSHDVCHFDIPKIPTQDWMTRQEAENSENPDPADGD